MRTSRVTRGSGVLERFLAIQRCGMANRLIPDHLRKGRLLDVGCGPYPLFLLNTEFSEKFGLDKALCESQRDPKFGQTVTLTRWDIERVPWPFEDGFFDVVTMLAVLEHVNSKASLGVLREIRRVLRRGGRCILTTPSPWADGPLKLMAKLRLVSSLEIEDHKEKYRCSRIISLLVGAGFTKEKLQVGYFELFMNIWSVAQRG